MAPLIGHIPSSFGKNLRPSAFPSIRRDFQVPFGYGAAPVSGGSSGWTLFLDMTAGGETAGAGFGAVSHSSFHGFNWDLCWSDDSNWVTCATGEGDIGLFRAFVGTGSPAIVTAGTINQGTYFYMDGCAEGGTHMVATGDFGFITGVSVPTMATLWQNDLNTIMGVTADARKVFIDSTGTNGIWVVSMNPGTVLILNASTGAEVGSVSVGDDWSEADNLTIFAADFDKTTNHLFACNGNGYFIDCSTPSAPTLAFKNTVTATFQCAIHGNSLWTHDCNSGFGTAPGHIHVWNLSTFTAPTAAVAYTVPTYPSTGHHSSSNFIYNALCVTPDGSYVFGAWGEPGESAIDVLQVTGSTLTYVTQIPGLTTPASGANLNGGAYGYAADGYGMKVSPDGTKLAVEWGDGPGSSSSGCAGVTVYNITNKAAITPINFIGTGAETKSAVIDDSGNVFVSTQYSMELFDDTGTLRWVSLPQLGNAHAAFRLWPFKDSNTWLLGGHSGADTSVWRTNGSGSATLLRDYNNAGGATIGETIYEQWDGHHLQVINNVGVSGGWGLSIYTIGNYVSDTANNNYDPSASPIDSWIDDVTYPPFQNGDSGALLIDGEYGVSGSHTWLSDENFGVVVVDTSTPSSLSAVHHDPIIRTNSPNAASYGGGSSVGGSTLAVGSATDIYVLYTLYFTDTACTQPMGWLPYAYNQANPAQPNPIDMSSPGGNNAITLNLQPPTGAKGVKIYGFNNPYGNPTFGYIPMYTGATLTNAGGIPYPSTVNITTNPSTWTVAMPVPSGSPGLTGTTGGSLATGSSYTGAVVYRDTFGAVCGWDFMNWVTLTGSQDAITVALPGSGSGLPPSNAVTQELWMYEHTPGVTINGPFEASSGLPVTEVGTLPISATSATVTGPVSGWGSNAGNPLSYTFAFGQWAPHAFQAAFGSNSITSVGTGSTRRIVVGCGDYGGRIYNPTTFAQTGWIPGHIDGGSSFAGHGVVNNRYTVTMDYTAAALTGEGGIYVYDHNPPNEDAPIKTTGVTGDTSSVGFSCWGANSAYSGITWYTPQNYVLVNTLSGPKILVPPS